MHFLIYLNYMTGTVLKLPSPPPPGHSPHLLSSRIHDITSIHICSVWSGFNLTQNDHHITLPHHLYNDEGNGTFNAIPILITTKGQLFAFCPALAILDSHHLVGTFGIKKERSNFSLDLPVSIQSASLPSTAFLSCCVMVRSLVICLRTMKLGLVRSTMTSGFVC